jgi:hypothetical protein
MSNAIQFLAGMGSNPRMLSAAGYAANVSVLEMRCHGLGNGRICLSQG